MTDWSLRQCREALGLSQLAFARQLGVAPESYRTWDAGRRPVPAAILLRARALVAHRDAHPLLPLPLLATLVGVHVRTLRNAALDGRLTVVYDTRTTFRHLRARATPANATLFRHAYYNKRVRSEDRRDPLTWAMIPPDYPAQIRAIRHRLGLSQTRFAALVGAARKAVVYQWETARRCPSPIFWERIKRLSASDAWNQRLPNVERRATRALLGSPFGCKLLSDCSVGCGDCGK